MTALPALALVLPLASALLLLGIERGRPRLARALNGTSMVLALALAIAALRAASGGGALAMALGPTGLVLVLDRLSAWMLVAASSTALIVFAHTARAPARGASRAHSLVQLQLFALDGVFLVGDLASLFMLLQVVVFASTSALARGTGTTDAAASRRAFLVNGGSAVAFAIAIGCIFVALGTLDLAGLSVAAPAVPAAEAGLLGSASFVLLGVLALGAIVTPLLLWLPGSGAAPPAFAVGLGALLAESCIYLILRLYTLVFPCFVAGPCGPSGLALPLGLTAVTAGALAALTAREARTLPAQLLVASVGVLLIAVGSFREAGLAAAIFLLWHTALAATALFLAADLLRRASPGRGRGVAVVGYFASLAALLCLPPLAGFPGLIAVLQASTPDALAVWTLVCASLLVAGIAVFRHESPIPAGGAASMRVPRLALAGSGIALGALLALGLAAAPVFDLARSTARQLLDRAAYVAAVRAARETR